MRCRSTLRLPICSDARGVLPTRNAARGGMVQAREAEEQRMFNTTRAESLGEFTNDLEVRPRIYAATLPPVRRGIFGRIPWFAP
jgi:hypothetical protein